MYSVSVIPRAGQLALVSTLCAALCAPPGRAADPAPAEATRAPEADRAAATPAAAATEPSAGDGPARGPLGLRIQGVLRELFLDPILLDARPLERPAVDLRWAAANSWNLPMRLVQRLTEVDQFFDEQADSLTASARWPWSVWLGPGPALPGSGRGLFARLSTAVEWRVTLHSGGWSDRPIELWHGLVGAFNYERDRYPRNQLHLLFRDSHGSTAFDLQSATLAPGDLVARTQLVLLEGEGGALAARLDLKIPLGALVDAGSSGGVDAALVLGGTALPGRRLTIHGQVALARFANFSLPIALQPKPWHFFADLSLQLHLLPGLLDFFLEDRVASPLLLPGWERLPLLGDDGLLSSGLYAGFRAHNQVSFGLRWRELSLWLSEDFTPGTNPHSLLQILYVSNSPDVVIGLSWSHRF